MADKTTPMPATTTTEQIRNVVLVGPSGSGKTTLFEALLHAGGATTKVGRIEDNSTISDHTDVEHQQQRSVTLGVATFDHESVRINLMDAPGYADFAGEVGAGLRAADAALFVIPAKTGLDGSTRLLWQQCADVEMPRAIVLSRVDVPEVNIAARIEELRSVLGASIMAFEVPLGPTSVIDLLTLTVHEHDGSGHAQRPATPQERDQVAGLRTALIEAIISEADDDALMEQYLADEELDSGALRVDVVKAVAHGRFHPVLFTSITPAGFGVDEILDLIINGFPSPVLHSIPSVSSLIEGKERSLSADAEGPLVAEVFKTTTDPYLGRLSHVRVFSGRMQTADVVHVSGHFTECSGHEDHDVDEKVGGLSLAFGGALHPVPAAIAGDIVVVARLNHAETGDTLSSKTQQVIMPRWDVPEPMHPVAIEAKARTDEDKLSEGLKRLAAEDPSVRIDRDVETKQTVLWCQGESHADVLIDRLRNGFGVSTVVTAFKVPLRETLAGPADGHGRLVKQSGGHGQYAVCDIHVEPIPHGEGLEFIDEVVGGAIPRQYIPSVEAGVRAQMNRGLQAGYPVVGLRVRLREGKAHSVDSSDMAFQLAGQLALQDAASKVGINMLEPISSVRIEVDDAYVGAVLGDIPSRRGRILGTAPAGLSGRTIISADIPDLEMTTYSVTLRSLAHGTGRFSREFSGYEALPVNVATRVLTTA
jgi:elongation factor G